MKLLFLAFWFQIYVGNHELFFLPRQLHPFICIQQLAYIFKTTNCFDLQIHSIYANLAHKFASRLVPCVFIAWLCNLHKRLKSGIKLTEASSSIIDRQHIQFSQKIVSFIWYIHFKALYSCDNHFPRPFCLYFIPCLDRKFFISDLDSFLVYSFTYLSIYSCIHVNKYMHMNI